MNEKENEKKEKFTPTQKQLKFSEVYLNYMKPRTNKEIAQKVGIDPSTIWRWFNNPDFLNWLNKLARDLLEKSLAKRYMVAIREAEGGNYNFSKLLLQIEGEFIPSQKIEGTRDPMQIKMEYVDTTGETLRKEITDKLDQIRSRIPPEERKRYLLKELKEIEKTLNGVPVKDKRGKSKE